MTNKLYRFKYLNRLQKESMIMALNEYFLEENEYNYDTLKIYPFLIEDMKTMYVLFSDDENKQLTTDYRTWEEKEVLDWPTRGLEPIDFDVEKTGINLMWFAEEIHEKWMAILSQVDDTIGNLIDLLSVTCDGAHKGRGGATIVLDGYRRIEIVLNFMDLYDITFVNNGEVVAKAKDVYFDYLGKPLLRDINEFLVTKY